MIDQSTAWFRAHTAHRDDVEAVIRDLPSTLEAFARQYNIELSSTNVEVRVVDDRDGAVLHYVDDHLALLAASAPALDGAEPTPTQQRSPTELANLRELFLEAYALFPKNSFADPNVSFQAFISVMSVTAGDSEAALRLLDAQQQTLALGMRLPPKAVEQFFAARDLRKVFSLEEPAALALSQALAKREDRIDAALQAAGWRLREEEKDEPLLDRPAVWGNGDRQLFREMNNRGWIYVGANAGTLIPLFQVEDLLDCPAERLVDELQQQIEAHWPAQAPAAPTKLEAPQSLDPEENAGPVVAEIDRTWRGATWEQLRDGQRDGAPPAFSAKRAFGLLKKAENDGLESLSSQERARMLAFKGWGGIAQEVRTDNRMTSKNLNGNEIAKALGMEVGEYNRTMLSNRLESYYTPAPLIPSIWQIITQAGVSPHGRFLEPGCGAGLFFAGAPEEVQRHARLVGVECDPIAVRLARVIAPDATILDKRLEQAVLDKGFDAVIGNVPFGETLISDSRYPAAQHIHDYFIVRSLDHLKPGGVTAFITSSGTMDKKDTAIREQIMQRANLVAAFRLPQQTFADQSASVVTDILVLQRRPDGTAPDYDFTTTRNVRLEHKGEIEEFPVNQYFHDHPEHVLGSFKVGSSAFGPKLTVDTNFDGYGYELQVQIAAALNELVKSAIPEPITGRQQWPQNELVPNSKSTAPNRSVEGAIALDSYAGLIGDYTIHDGKLVEILDLVDQFDDAGVCTGSRYLAGEVDLSEKTVAVLKAYIPLRDAARVLVDAQLNGTDEALKLAQETALAQYHGFVAAHGPVNSRANLRIFGDDAGSAEVCALEVWDDDEEKVTQLAEAFTERVVRMEGELHASTSEDAYCLCIDRVGHIDLEWMEQVSGIAQQQLLDELLGHLIFVDPTSGQYVSSDVYLSGNVVKKLADAQQAVLLDERYAINVESLKAVQPDAIPFEDITIRIGANWIPSDEIRHFASHLMGRKLSEADFKVRYVEGAGMWSVDVSSAFKRDFEAQRTAIYGTDRASFEGLLEKLLNSQRPTHTYRDEKSGKTQVDDEATLASRTKQDELNELFFSWVANDPNRVERFCVLYNESCNVIRVPTPDGSRLTFPGLAPSWKPRDHQKDMVAMAMMGYNDMAAHPVGAGKTFEMVAIAMKLGQLGMHQKPMIAVPNHMLGQISREAKQMYPGARILMVTNDDLRGNNRRRFLAIARNNKWDIVVCTHSMLNQISAPLEIQLREYDKQLSVIEAKIVEADSPRVARRLEAQGKTLRSQRDQLHKTFEDEEKRNGVLTLDQLGVDALLVDEAHLYKNLALNSGMNVLGVTTGGSGRASNLNQLGEYLRDLHGKSFGLHFFTGTPIANSMCELYVHNKILRPEILDEIGICHFDEWANRFGDVVSSLEALPEGGGFRVNERFARFVNLPEMIKLFRTFADVRTKDQLKLPTPEVHTHVISVQQSAWQAAFMKHLAIRAVAVRKGHVDPKEDNMLSIATAGRKAALDMRLVSDILPEDSSLKLSMAAEKIHEVWERHGDVKGTQLVFMDLGTPGKDKPFSCYEALKLMLVEKGIPEHEIAFIHDAKTNDAKEAIFAKVRSGEIRVLMGSTEKMGVGTNVQERLCALHNIDCPWRPADIEQRLGRIARQGNLFFEEVEEYRYTTKDSFDLFMWETNKRKASFISQALADPASASREVAEEMDLGYAEVMAVTTGNPKIREKVEIDDQVIKLERKYKAWLSDRANKVSMRNTLERDLRHETHLLTLEERVKEALPKTRFRNVTVAGAIAKLQDGDTTWLYASPVGEAILKKLPLIEARLMRNNEQFGPLNMRIGELELVVELKDGLFGKQVEIRGLLDGSVLPMNIVSPTKNEQILGRSVREWFSFDERIHKRQGAIQRAKQGLEALADFSMDSAWPLADELEALKQRKSELDSWFSSQDFDQLATGPDPFLLMLEEYRASRQEIDIEDGLEEVVKGVDFLDEIDQDDLLFDDTKTCGKALLTAMR